MGYLRDSFYVLLFFLYMGHTSLFFVCLIILIESRIFKICMFNAKFPILSRVKGSWQMFDISCKDQCISEYYLSDFWLFSSSFFVYFLLFHSSESDTVISYESFQSWIKEKIIQEGKHCWAGGHTDSFIAPNLPSSVSWLWKATFSSLSFFFSLV